MSAISEYAAKQQAHNDVIDAGIASLQKSNTSLQSSVDGLTADNKFFKDTIAQLQANPGPITADDQKLLDALEARTAGQATALTAAAASLDADATTLSVLDASTPPVVPPVTGGTISVSNFKANASKIEIDGELASPIPTAASGATGVTLKGTAAVATGWSVSGTAFICGLGTPLDPADTNVTISITGIPGLADVVDAPITLA